MLHELNLADGSSVDIAASAITYVEGLDGEQSPSFPSARTFIRYSVGETDFTALAEESFEEVRTMTMLGGAMDWCESERSNGNRIRFRGDHVLLRRSAHEGDAEGTQSAIRLAVDRSNTVAEYTLVTPLAELREMMAPPRHDAPPPGLVEMPHLPPPPNRHDRRAAAATGK